MSKGGQIAYAGIGSAICVGAIYLSFLLRFFFVAAMMVCVIALFIVFIKSGFVMVGSAIVASGLLAFLLTGISFSAVFFCGGVVPYSILVISCNKIEYNSPKNIIIRLGGIIAIALIITFLGLGLYDIFLSEMKILSNWGKAIGLVVVFFVSAVGLVAIDYATIQLLKKIVQQLGINKNNSQKNDTMQQIDDISNNDKQDPFS